MHPLAPLALLASAAFAAGPASAAAAFGTTQVIQQRTSDGRVLLTDRPAPGAKTERTWQMRADDPATARQRELDVKAEARQVSERIQRTLDQQRRADEENERTRLARMEFERRDGSSDEQLLYAPYGAAYPLTNWRGNSRFDCRGRGFDCMGHGNRPHPPPHRHGHRGSMFEHR
jgi:hypothetical protein